MSKTVDEINALYRERLKQREPFLNKCREIAELANGEVRIVHPEIDANEKATVVNLFPGGLDALATRAASIQPDQIWSPLRDGIQASEDKARMRRDAGLGWWSMQNMNLMDRRRFRYHFGYGCMPISICPAAVNPLDKRDMPHWRVRNPLTAFPAPCDDEGDIEPEDAIFVSRRTRAWLTACYPQMRRFEGENQRRPDDLFEVLEYVDCDEIVLACANRVRQETGSFWTANAAPSGPAVIELERIPNKAGMPLAVFPGRITLDRLQGALDQMLPAYHKAAKLESLNLLAIAESIYPEKWVVGHPGDPQAPEIVTDADGMMGIIGEVAHGQIMTLGNPPAAAQAADMATDRLERSQRLVAGLPAEISGESATNIRTARRGEQVLGSAIDMPIQEAQEIMAASKEAELRRAVAVQKGWFGAKATSFYIPRDGSIRRPDYTPNEVFETDDVVVKYSMAGADANSLVIALGQRVNMGTMSIETAMDTDPLIEDPTLERDRVELEGLRRALLTSLEQQATQGMLGPDQIAAIAKAKWSTHDELEDVVLRVHEQMQQKQAAQAQMQPGAPGTQPGLGGQGPGNFNGPPVQPQLAQALQTLRAPGAGQQPAPQAPNPLQQ